MESNLSCLSSLREDTSPVYIQPHYKETYRLAIYALLCGGKEAYEEFLRAEQISHFLSEEEILFIFQNAELPAVVVEEDQDDSPTTKGKRVSDEEASPSTYFPTESDEAVPDLDLGWPEVSLETVDTSISLLFHPPRHNTPTIKEVVRKQIQEARQVVAIAMDVFTDVDIFKEIITATLRGVVVYILLDDAHFKSFLTMSHRVGINVRDLKNIRVRTVRGQQYQCRSGLKFCGDLEQKFLLVDCRTVLFGTYSYSWSFEKINLSMVLVITGQLVASYDEEFRRLYAQSAVATVLSGERSSIYYLRDAVAHQQSPNSSQLHLNRIQARPKVMHGVRSAQDDRFNNGGGVMTRGLSVQERLHQSHCFDMGNLIRGHSYGGELQKLSALTRMRMGTKDIGVPVAPEKTVPNPRGGDDLLLTNRLSQQHLRHQNRYGTDQNLIPFNSETSLHKWKMDTYFNDVAAQDASCDAISPVASPYSSHTGLNEQLIHNRSRDIKSRMEEMRQKRLSLQDYNNPRPTQDTLRPAYQPKYMSPLRGQDMRQNVAELEPRIQNGYSLELANHEHSEPNKRGDRREQTLTGGHRSASHHDVTANPRTTQAYDWHEPLSRTTSAIELDMKLNDPSIKLGLQHPRPMESLTEIPEERECSRVNSSDSAVFKDASEEICQDEKSVSEENSMKSSVSAESQRRDQARGSRASLGKMTSSSGSAAPRARKKSISDEAQTKKTSDASPGSQHGVEAKGGHAEKQREEPPLQRKNSLRMKVCSLLSPDEKKVSKKDERSTRSRTSLKSQRSSGHRSQSPVAVPTTNKGQSPSISRSQNSLSSQTEQRKSPFSKLSPQRSSKRRQNPAGDQDRGSRSTMDGDEATAASHHTRKEKVYSRYEYLLSTDSFPVDKSEKDSGSSLNRNDSAADNKLGRFMQRVGNLINKNK